MARVIIVVRSPWGILVAFFAIGLAFTLAFTLTRIASRVFAPVSDAVCGRTIVIDPGHGGPDPGAVGPGGLMEKDVALDVAKRLEAMFNRVAVYTIMTREGDTDLIGEGGISEGNRKRLDLEMRVKTANESRADLYISIHANSFPDKVWSGAQTFYHAASAESRLLAEAIQRELSERLGPNLRRARPGDHYYVLRNTNMPSVIVEVGFLSNPAEENLLSQPDYRRRLAEAVFHGTVNYLVEAYRRERRGREPEPRVREAIRSPGGDWDQRALSVGEDEIVLYFAGPTNFDDALMPELRSLPPGTGSLPLRDRVRLAVEELMRGPGKGSILHPTLPPGVTLISVAMRDHVVYLDFSREIALNHWGGSRSEELTIYSIVNTVASLPGVDKVVISIEGESDASIAGHIILNEPFRWNPGIIQSRAQG